MNKLYTLRLSLAFAFFCCPAVVLGINDAVNYLPYDCQENDCDVGDCDFATGKCLGCDQDSHDYACRPINLDTCSGCAVDGPLLETVGTDFCTSAGQCACAEGQHGADCTTKTLDIACAADNIDITVSPYPKLDGTPFGGKIFFSGIRNIDFATHPDNCQSSGAASFQRVLGPSGAASTTCSSELGAPTTTGGGLVMYVYVQQRLDVRGSSDQFIRVACMGAASAGTGTFEIQSALDTVEPLPSTVDSAASGVTLSIQKQTGPGTWADIGANLVVGDDISLILSHTTKFYPRECRVTNLDPAASPILGNFRQLWLFKEWCVPKESESFFRAVPTFLGTAVAGGQATGEFGWRMDLKAFYFAEGGSNKLYFMCFICDSITLTDCEVTTAPSCSNDFYDYSALNGQIRGARRRRDIPVVSGLGTTNTSLAVHITVESNIVQGDDCNGSSESANVQDCYKSTSVLLPIILLAALLLITMVMTFFFCMKVTRFQDQQQKMSHDNMSYKS